MGSMFWEKSNLMVLVYGNWVVVSNIFYFHPYLGKVSNLTNIFQMGWNHQPGNFEGFSLIIQLFGLVIEWPLFNMEKKKGWKTTFRNNPNLDYCFIVFPERFDLEIHTKTFKVPSGCLKKMVATGILLVDHSRSWFQRFGWNCYTERSGQIIVTSHDLTPKGI